MPSRAELLIHVDSSKMSPFLLCNLLGRRARQLGDGWMATGTTERINEALRQFLNGELKYEFDGRRAQTVPSSIATRRYEKCPSNCAIR